MAGAKWISSNYLAMIIVVITGLMIFSRLDAATTYVKDSTEPTSGVITGLTVDGASFTRIFDPNHTSGNASADRGQVFLVPDNSTGLQFNIYEIAVVADAARDFSSLPGAALTLWVFQWGPSNDANDRST